ncbi:MAG: prohibitin family protein [Bacteroidota bacterium]|jgi:regulator of protease activity HflC (stomatin/prohibitin superfamily)|nr:prohibitin family protein [Ignavibacteria bacterium]MCU7500196.1 prohibitin family protein [Ignavibacteria bacterium]MCU7513856.1 prohibitin family protein [Ignavibacteria bacterium]MCU7521554.1 prohibitin family protein [Ignavibacteria bacterium]MCU7525008.1 prohibitin family protein [Ignavibacteria bacterium]
MVFLISLLAAAVAFAVHVTAKKRYSKSEATFAGAGAVIALIIALLQVFTVIPAGSVGVVDFLGMVSDNTLKAGVNLVNPLANVVKFSVKTQEIKESMTVPSKEGLTVQLEISVLYSLNPENASRVYKTLGENYAEIILEPQFRSVVRGVTSGYEAKALYTSQREELASRIEKELSKLVNRRGITIEAAPLRQIILPAGLTASIEEKLKAEQESQRMEFVLRKETQEAERKRIEAKGIADFQDIVSKGISTQLLKWKGIEATEKLANSQNSKVIVIGSGKEGLPVILGNDK